MSLAPRPSGNHLEHVGRIASLRPMMFENWVRQAERPPFSQHVLLLELAVLDLLRAPSS